MTTDPTQQTNQLLEALDAESRALVYQSIQELASLVSEDTTALVYSKDPGQLGESPSEWNLVIRLSNEEMQIESEAEGASFHEALMDAKGKMIHTLLDIQSQMESSQERSKTVDMMAHEGYRYLLH